MVVVAPEALLPLDVEVDADLDDPQPAARAPRMVNPASVALPIFISCPPERSFDALRAPRNIHDVEVKSAGLVSTSTSFHSPAELT